LALEPMLFGFGGEAPDPSGRKHRGLRLHRGFGATTNSVRAAHIGLGESVETTTQTPGVKLGNREGSKTTWRASGLTRQVRARLVPGPASRLVHRGDQSAITPGVAVHRPVHRHVSYVHHAFYVDLRV